MSDDLVFKSAEASKGAFQGIKKLRGRQVSITRKPGRAFEDSEKTPKDQVEIKLEDVAILEMAPGEVEPELKNGEFTFWIAYAQPGKKPHKSSLYIKGFVASAERLGKTPPEFNGEFVVLAREMVHLFTDQQGKDVSYEGWVYQPDEATTSTSDILVHIQKLVVGNNKSTATRNLLTDARAKQYPDFRKAIVEGTHEEKLGVVLVGGKYQLKEVTLSESSPS